jgi:hypothetical protein
MLSGQDLMGAPTRWAWAVAGVMGPAAACGGQVKQDSGSGDAEQSSASDGGTGLEQQSTEEAGSTATSGLDAGEAQAQQPDPCDGFEETIDWGLVCAGYTVEPYPLDATDAGATLCELPVDFFDILNGVNPNHLSVYVDCQPLPRCSPEESSGDCWWAGTAESPNAIVLSDAVCERVEAGDFERLDLLYECEIGPGIC